MARPVMYGDAGGCPQDPEGHGTMYWIGWNKSIQWCPHSAHQGSPYYDFNGVPVPLPAPEDSHSGADKVAGNQPLWEGAGT